jgi:Ca2+-binding EF-hand superfamily protein
MEFLLAVSLTSSKDPGRKIELFFSMYDIDHNGLIDENEMRSFIAVCC